MRFINASRLPLKPLNLSLTVYGDFNILGTPFGSFEAFKDASLYEKCYEPFSLVFEDTSTNQFLLVRDHFGQRPLFYCIDDNQLIVADNIPELIKHLKTTPELLKHACDNLYPLQKSW